MVVIVIGDWRVANKYRSAESRVGSSRLWSLISSSTAWHGDTVLVVSILYRYNFLACRSRFLSDVLFYS